MIDWTEPFDASYVLAAVDRRTGAECEPGAVEVSGGSISRNLDSEAKESGSLEVVGRLDLGPALARVYLVATQGGEASRECLGTFVPQAPASTFTGSAWSASASLAGRLSEIAGDDFDAPVSFPKGTAVLPAARSILEGAGFQVVQVHQSTSVLSCDRTYGIGEDDSSKLAAVNDLLDLAGFSSVSTDAWGRAVLRRAEDIAERPLVWTMAEGKDARFLREVEEELDESCVANVVRAVYSDQGSTVVGTAIDDDPTGRWSVPTRGYRVTATYRYSGTVSQAEADAKALSLLRTQQSAVHRVTLPHIYAPFTVGDAVRVDYPSAGISGRFAARTMELELGPGCLTRTEFRRFVR